MSNWLLAERDRLRRYDLRAIIIGNVVIVTVLTGIMVLAYMAADAAGLPGGLTGIVLLLLLLVILPVVPLLLMDRLRTRVWLWLAEGELRRLRAQRFLTHYVDLIGRVHVDRMRGELHELVDSALYKEQEGSRIPPKEYARALQAVLHIEPPPGAAQTEGIGKHLGRPQKGARAKSHR